MLAYEKEGTGFPIVFLHAFPLSKAMWAPIKSGVAKNYQAIALDFPGFGDSVLSKDTTTMENMAKEVLSTLDSLDVRDRFVLVGVSMGGYVMFQVLKQAAHRVRGLVFVSTRSTPDTEEMRERRRKTIEALKASGSAVLADKMLPDLLGKTTHEGKLSVVSDVRACIEKTNPDAACAALRGMMIRGDSTQHLQNINVPTLVLSGAEDKMVPSRDMNLLARLIPRAKFETMAGVGHLPPLEDPAGFEAILTGFLKKNF